jgi:hypothetical protein
VARALFQERPHSFAGKNTRPLAFCLQYGAILRESISAGWMMALTVACRLADDTAECKQILKTQSSGLDSLRIIQKLFSCVPATC